MDNNDFLLLYNPANAANLTAEQIDAMKNLTDEQIDALAKAYPNTPGGSLYLLLWDDNVKPEKQFYQMSSWQNLRNLRKFNGAKNFRPYTFKSRFTPAAKDHKQAASGIRKPTSPNKVIVDLSAKEAADDLRKTLAAKKQPAAEAAVQTEGQGQGQEGQKPAPKTSSKKKTAAPTPTPASTATTSQETPPDQVEDDPTAESPAAE